MKPCRLMLLMIASVTTPATARLWTDAKGKSQLEADYVEFQLQDEQVKLKVISTGKVLLVPLAALSEQDQAYVRERAAREKEDQLREAEKLLQPFHRAIHEAPTDPQRWVARGLQRMELKDCDGARADFSRAIELDPKSVRAYTGRGMALQSKNELIAAHKDFGKAIELDPKVASAYRNRGENLYRLALDPRQNSLPEADDLVRECHTRWLAERVQRAKQLPWQPIICGARDLPRPAAIMQGAQVDFQYANRLEKTQSCEERPNVGNGGPTEGR